MWMTEKQSEELAFSVLFPKGRFGYTARRDIETSVKYFNARLFTFEFTVCNKCRIFVLCTVHKFGTKKYLIASLLLYEKYMGSLSELLIWNLIHKARRISHQKTRLICFFVKFQALSTILAKIFVWSCSHGTEAWFITLSLCSSRVTWTVSSNIARTKGMNMMNEEVEDLSYHKIKKGVLCWTLILLS